MTEYKNESAETSPQKPVISAYDFTGKITQFDRDRLTAYTTLKGITWMDAIEQIIADPEGMHKIIDSVVPDHLRKALRPKHTDYQIKYQ